MRKLIIMALGIMALDLQAQPIKVTESVTVNKETLLQLDFDFADNISFQLWDKPQVLVEVLVEINDGEDNDIFSLNSSTSSTTILIAMDEDMWKKIPKERRNKRNCSFTSTLDYVVYLPKELKVSASTISGDYEFEYFNQPMQLKTISGAIDVTIPSNLGLDFKAKTISGEVYSDIEIDFPEGKKGLKQIVGQDFKGRINGGGPQSELETISGNIYLRKD